MSDVLDELDLDEILGLDKCLVDKSPEEQFVAGHTFGPNPRFFNLYHWLTHVMSQFQFQKEKGFQVARSTMRDGVPGKYELSNSEYANTMLEYYLCMMHFYSFDTRRQDKERICDMATTISLVMKLEEVQKIIARKF